MPTSSTWQLISTAPKDGTPFLAYGNFDYNFGRCISNIAVCSFKDGHLYVETDSHGDVDIDNVTYWMPLSEPPKEGI